MSVNKTIERYVKKIQPLIRYCYNCQAHDGGEIIWVQGHKINLEEIYDEYNIPEKHREQISLELQCLYCGTELSRYDDIGCLTAEDIIRDQYYKEWEKTIQPKLKDFQTFLEKYPYLGLNHEVGKKISKMMYKFPKHQVYEEIWVRGRKINSSRKYSQSDMYPPEEYNCKAEGRFNHYGQSFLYLSQTEQGCVNELLLDEEELLWIQKFKIDSDDILNLDSFDINELDEGVPMLILGLINNYLPYKEVNHNNIWKPEYFIPRFIADCAREHGFKGIKYRTITSGETNLVMFNFNEPIVVPIGVPSIFDKSSSPKKILPF